jgi:DNA invertase Pin-like site-specific DNA recombinase
VGQTRSVRLRYTLPALADLSAILDYIAVHSPQGARRVQARIQALTDLLVMARELQRAGAGIRSLAEPYLDTTSDFAEIVFAILGVAAKLERCRILERTARGRADAKEKGVKFGRKPKLTAHQQREAHQRIAAGETQRSVARSYNVSQSTISRLTEPIRVKCIQSVS